MKSLLISFTLLAMLGLSPAALSADSLRAVQVSVGGNGEADACGAVGQVNLSARVDKHLIVRDGPGASYRAIDKLRDGRRLYTRDAFGQGKWRGVVYGEDGGGCDVTGPIEKAKPYTGPCGYGWVRAAWVEVIAG